MKYIHERYWILKTNEIYQSYKTSSKINVQGHWPKSSPGHEDRAKPSNNVEKDVKGNENQNQVKVKCVQLKTSQHWCYSQENTNA